MEKNAEAGDAACEGVTSCSCAPNNLNKAIKVSIYIKLLRQSQQMVCQRRAGYTCKRRVRAIPAEWSSLINLEEDQHL